MKENEELQLVKETEILGSKIALYGSVENPFFKADDVAQWIGHSNVSKMLINIDKIDKVKAKLSTLTNSYTALFANENGLYEVLMQSRKPIAKELKKEIKKYLKQIRMTGAAFEQGRENEAISYYFSQFSDNTKLAMLKELEEKNKKFQQFYDDLLNTEGLMDINTVGKELEIGEHKLFKYLRNKKILFYNSEHTNVPYERFRNEDKFKVKKVLCRDGKYRDSTLVTNKGLEYIRKQMRKDGLMEVQA